MKRLIFRFSGLILYLLLVLWLLDFNIGLLFDMRSLLLVLSGTLLLTAGSYRRGLTLTELREHAVWNSMVTGFLTAFMMLFSVLYQNISYTELLPELALCMRPLFYALVLQVLCKPISADRADQNGQSEKAAAPGYSALTPDEVKYLLREHTLTDRELEIALAIWRNLSVKEISDELCISESTVKKHSTSLYKKLQVENREQLKQYLNQLHSVKKRLP